MHSLNKIKITSALAVICLLYFLLHNFIIYIFGEPFTVSDKVSSNELWYIYCFIGIELVYQTIVVLLIVLLFIRFYKGEALCCKNINYIFCIGWIFLLYPVYSQGFDYLLNIGQSLNNVDFTIAINLVILPLAYSQHIIFGIILLPIAYILRHASLVKSELDKYI
ncbi:hypothetical protein [Spartinivicinus ruber]|uniref:hypothetical protein n=1 Tax=Spartinivicinus ruber TaxID=2683272 RepID=UPI0013D4823E|nr:hypothetical protein [Spartinivicinus ruber]